MKDRKATQKAAVSEKKQLVSSYTQKGISFSSMLRTQPARKTTTVLQAEPSVQQKMSNERKPASPPKQNTQETISFEYFHKFIKLAEEIKDKYARLTSEAEKQALIGCAVINLALNGNNARA